MGSYVASCVKSLFLFCNLPLSLFRYRLSDTMGITEAFGKLSLKHPASYETMGFTEAFGKLSLEQGIPTLGIEELSRREGVRGLTCG